MECRVSVCCSVGVGCGQECRVGVCCGVGVCVVVCIVVWSVV